MWKQWSQYDTWLSFVLCACCNGLQCIRVKTIKMWLLFYAVEVYKLKLIQHHLKKHMSLEISTLYLVLPMLLWVSQLSCIPLSGTPYITLPLSRVDIDDNIRLICKHIQHMKHKVSYLGFISYHKIVVVLTWFYWFKNCIVMWRSYHINLLKDICLEAVFL